MIFYVSPKGTSVEFFWGGGIDVCRVQTSGDLNISKVVPEGSNLEISFSIKKAWLNLKQREGGTVA